MRKIISITRAYSVRSLFTAGLVFAMALTFSCSNDDGGGNTGTSGLKKEKISGVSQKGPFKQGATVKIYDLGSSTPLASATVKDSKGNFEIPIPNGQLPSQYVLLEVSGTYANEVTGGQDTITLKAVADVSDKDNVNINVLTHLEHKSVLEQVKKGTSFETAKVEAQSKVLTALGISPSTAVNSEDMALFGNSSNADVLLAVSIMLQADRSAEAVSELLNTFSGQIANSGTVEQSIKTDIASGLANVDMNQVANNISNIDNSAKLPDFSNIFASSSSNGRDNNSSSSVGSGNGSGTGTGTGNNSSSSVGSGNGSGTGTGTGNNSSSSVGSGNGSGTGTGTGNNSSSSVGSGSGTGTGSSDLCTGFIDGTKIMHNGKEKAQFCDKRDGKKYVYVAIGWEGSEQIWMAENLNYDTKTSGSACYAGGEVSVSGVSSTITAEQGCAKYGRLYNWETAKTACPEGWHLPISYTDLKSYVGAAQSCSNCDARYLRAENSWFLSGSASTGSDPLGFSALPGGYGTSDGNFDYAGTSGRWWLDKENDTDATAVFFSNSKNVSDIYDNQVKAYLFSVRCVKDN